MIWIAISINYSPFSRHQGDANQPGWHERSRECDDDGVVPCDHTDIDLESHLIRTLRLLAWWNCMSFSNISVDLCLCLIGRGAKQLPYNNVSMDGNYKRSFEARLLPPNLRVKSIIIDIKWLPAPSPAALRIHSYIAKILDKSGIAKQLNEILFWRRSFW